MKLNPYYMRGEATTVTVRHGSGAIHLVFNRTSGGVKRWQGFSELSVEEALNMARILTNAAQKAASIQATFDHLDAPRENA